MTAKTTTTMYVTGAVWSDEITTVEVVRFSAKCVWFQPEGADRLHRALRVSKYERCHDTYAHALNYLIARNARAVDGARAALTIAETRMRIVRDMKAAYLEAEERTR